VRVLVNYEAEEKGYLPMLAGILKNHGHTAAATTETLSVTTAQSLTKKAEASALILCNASTLANLVHIPTKKEASVSTFRGSRLNFDPPVIVINPLAHIRSVPYGKWLLEKDLSKLSTLNLPALQVGFRVCDTKDTCNEALQVLSNASILSIDIETDEHARITCVGITGLIGSKTRSFIFSFYDFGLDHFGGDRTSCEYVYDTLRRICLSDIPKCMFNATYDAQYLVRYGAFPRNLVFDVMGMAHSQYSELPKTLDFVTSLYCHDYYYWKHESDLSKRNNDIRGYWHYCIKDSWYTLRCLLAMWKTYPQYAIQNYQRQFKLTYPSLYCSFEGFLIDEKARIEGRRKAEAACSAALANLRIMSRCSTFNPGSSKQVAGFIYDVLGAKKIKDRSTDKKVMARVAEQHPLLARVIEDISEYRENAKAISTYFDFKQWLGRVMFSFSPFSTDTARFSCKASNFWCGTQLQNQPEYAKDYLIADEGFILMEKDNNKSEARCVAFCAPCPGLKAVLADKEKDFYKALGTLFFGIPYEQVTKELRNKVLKKIIHGTNYMMGEATFIMNVGAKQLYDGAGMLGMVVVSLPSFVKFLLGTYHKAFPEVAVHYGEIKREILRTRMLVSPLGYTRYFFGDIIEDHKILRGAVAHEPQNLSVGILNRGFWKAWKICIESDGEFRLKGQIHDSILSQVLVGKKDHYSLLLDKAMDNPVTVKGDVLSIPVDTAFGHSWKSLKD